MRLRYAGLVMLLLCAPASAQPPAADAPLAGPRSAAPKKAASLVDVDFEGRVRRPEVNPERAAVAVLALDDATRARVDELFLARDAFLEAFVSENIDLLIKVATSAAAGDTLDLIGLGSEVWRKTEAMREKGPLQDQVRSLLPPEQAAKFDSLVNEYWEAVIAEGGRALDKNGKKRNRLGIVIEERLRILGKEVESAFQRVEKSGTLAADYLLQGIELTPQQQERVRELKVEVARESMMGAPNGDRFGAQVLAILTEEQRAKVAERLYGRRKQDAPDDK